MLPEFLGFQTPHVIQSMRAIPHHFARQPPLTHLPPASCHCPPAGITLLIPHVPGIMTDYFAGRRAGRPGDLHCEGLPGDAPRIDADACRVGAACSMLWQLNLCPLPYDASLMLRAAGAHMAVIRCRVPPPAAPPQPPPPSVLPVPALQSAQPGCSCPRLLHMQDAHADVVLWSSWTSFFSNSLVSIVLVSPAHVAAQPVQLPKWDGERRRLPAGAPAAGCSLSPFMQLRNGRPPPFDTPPICRWVFGSVADQ